MVPPPKPPPNPYTRVYDESTGARAILDAAIKTSVTYCLPPTFTCDSVPMWRMEVYNNLSKRHGLCTPDDETFFSPMIELTRQYALYLIHDCNWTNLSTVKYVLLEHKLGKYGTAGLTEVLLGQKKHLVTAPSHIQELVQVMIEDKKNADRGNTMSFNMLIFFCNGVIAKHNDILGHDEWV